MRSLSIASLALVVSSLGQVAQAANSAPAATCPQPFKVTFDVEWRGMGAGTSIPKPIATPSASSVATFASIDTTRSRMAAVCTRVSSKRKARMMCSFSTDDWLFQNSVACV